MAAFLSDGTYDAFLNPEFESSRYANSIIASSTTAAALAQLSSGIAKLDSELKTQVSENHKDLLTQTTAIEKLEGGLKMVSSRVQSLQTSISRVQEKVMRPYSIMVVRTKQLERLQMSCELLRRTVRLLHLFKRLHSQADTGARDLAKAAQTVMEIEGVCDEMDMTSITIISSQLPFLKSMHAHVLDQGDKMLQKARETSNLSQLTSSFQILHNLCKLEDRMKVLIETQRQNAQNAINIAFNVSSIDLTKSSARSLVWTQVEKMTTEIQKIATQVFFVHSTLLKTRDSSTHALLVDSLLLEETRGMSQILWSSITNQIHDRINAVLNAYVFVRSLFENEYPKLLHLLLDIWTRVQSVLSSDDFGNFMQDAQQSLRIFGLETSYLKKAINRMFDPVHLAFTPGTTHPPTVDDVIAIVNAMHHELSIASFDDHLCLTIAKGVVSTIRLFCVKSEAMLVTDPVQLDISPSILSLSVQSNVVLVSRLHQLQTSILRSSGIIVSVNVSSLIKSSIENDIGELISNALSTIFISLFSFLEKPFHQMHNDNYFGHRNNDTSPDSPCSPYILDLQSRVRLADSQYLSLLPKTEAVAEKTKELTKRLLRYFVVHCSLLRKLSEDGKLSLAADMAQFELAMSPLQTFSLTKVSDLGLEYKMIRSFRPLLFLESEHILSNASVGNSLSFSIVLHHLFSRGPQHLRPPHIIHGWKIYQYAQWLEMHSEKEALQLVSESLEDYVTSVNSRGEKEFALVYPIMQSLLEQARRS